MVDAVDVGRWNGLGGMGFGVLELEVEEVKGGDVW
jgi:hypothetical protein